MVHHWLRLETSHLTIINVQSFSFSPPVRLCVSVTTSQDRVSIGHLFFKIDETACADQIAGCFNQFV